MDLKPSGKNFRTISRVGHIGIHQKIQFKYLFHVMIIRLTLLCDTENVELDHLQKHRVILHKNIFKNGLHYAETQL